MSKTKAASNNKIHSKKQVKAKNRKPPSKILIEQGCVVSVIFKAYSTKDKDYISKEVTGYVKDKTRIMYPVISKVTDIPSRNGKVNILYQIRKVYLNPSNITAVKVLDIEKFSSEYAFIQFIKSNEEEFEKATKNGE